MSDRWDSRIRGRVYLKRRYVSRDRFGRLRIHSTWAYEVRVGKKVYLYDDTGDYDLVVAACIRDVASVRRIYRAGHRFARTWDEILEATR